MSDVAPACPAAGTDAHAAAGSAAVVIEPVTDRRGRERFLRVPWSIYRDDPNWVPPLLAERRAHLDPRRNPYFEHAEAAFWLARRDGRDVGRISAQVDRLALEHHGERTGHFGFLEADDDPEIFAALLATAEGWLRDRGMTRIRGPFSLSINDESGLLVEGFGTRPSIMMGYAPPYYAPRLEAQGYGKAMDLICYDYEMGRQLPAVARFVENAKRDPGLRLRALDSRRFERDLEAIIDIFNDAWSDNWGFVPMTDAEIRHLGRNLKPLVRPGFVAIAELSGEPVAMAVSLPDINAMIADLDGRLLPFGWARLLWRIKLRRPESARVALMGVRKRFHGTPFGAVLALSVIDAIREYHAARGARRAELSWVLEDNRPMRRMIELFGARPYKTYRIYERDLA